MSTTRRSLAAAAAGLVLVAGLAGCGAKEIDNGKVEKELKSKLQERAPDHKYGKVECHDDLKAEVGKKSDCDIEVDGVKIKYDAKVVKVDGDTVNYEFTPG